jgi:very-short-patch-repair endonuclease
LSVKTSKPTIDITHPEVAAQWHPTKNGELTPYMVTYGSGKKVWWICDKNHEWQAPVVNRSGKNRRNCPYCSHQKVGYGNDLETNYPELAKEWHPSKNGDLMPSLVMPFSHKKVWWLCSKNHEWEASLAKRSSGHGCHYCTNQTSKPELYLLSELKSLFNKVSHREKFKGYEVDIFIHDLNLGVEFDGVYFHQKILEKDQTKRRILKENKIDIMAIREKPLSRIEKHDYLVKKNPDKFLMVTGFLAHLKKYSRINKSQSKRIEKYLKQNKPQNQELYKNLLSFYPGPLPGESLSDHYPNIAKEWHPTKNGNLSPSNIAPRSGEKIWWLCEKRHDFEASVDARTGKTGRKHGLNCPYCQNRKVGYGNDLQSNNSELANQWHPTMNGNLLPSMFTPASGKKVWWICKKNHEWEASIGLRNSGQNCPYCSNKKVGYGNDLQSKNPKLSKQWHFSRNGKLKPNMVTPGSNKKVWWICEKSHEWEASVYSRNKLGSNCPHCWAIRRRSG